MYLTYYQVNPQNRKIDWKKTFENQGICKSIGKSVLKVFAKLEAKLLNALQDIKTI